MGGGTKAAAEDDVAGDAEAAAGDADRGAGSTILPELGDIKETPRATVEFGNGSGKSKPLETCSQSKKYAGAYVTEACHSLRDEHRLPERLRQHLGWLQTAPPQSTPRRESCAWPTDAPHRQWAAIGRLQNCGRFQS